VHDLVAAAVPIALPKSWTPKTRSTLYTSGTPAAQGTGSHHRRLCRADLHHSKYVFDLRDEDIYWCTATSAGSRAFVCGVRPAEKRRYVMMYEGAPNGPTFPDFGKSSTTTGHHLLHRATPSAPSSSGATSTSKALLGLAALLGTVGEPINRGWMWYARRSSQRCPSSIPGGKRDRPILIAPIPGRAHQARSATRPFFGIQPEVVNKEASRCLLAMAACSSCASMALHGPHHLRRPERYQKTYWSDIEGSTSQRRARQDADGYFWLMGRGRCDQRKWHRLGTMEVESALVAHPRWPRLPCGPPDELKDKPSRLCSLESGNEPAKS